MKLAESFNSIDSFISKAQGKFDFSCHNTLKERATLPKITSSHLPLAFRIVVHTLGVFDLFQLLICMKDCTF